jgi:phosphopantetheine--protein transferase-like protein
MVHIYWNLVDELPGRGVDFLSPIEKERLALMRFERRRQSFYLGRFAAKQILQVHPACANLPATSITIANHPEGGPYGKIGDCRMEGSISLSHRESEAASAMVIHPGVTVGIDLELVEERERAFVEDFFTSQESAQIDLLPEEEKFVAVTRTWSAKEAVLKALGIGLRVDSRAVTINQSQRTSGKDDWKLLDASGPALEDRVCQVWWRPWGQYVLTLAITAKKDSLTEFEPTFIERVL